MLTVGSEHPLTTLASALLTFICISIGTNLIRQLLFANPHRPPVVFHWIPSWGSTVDYGKDPYAFFFRCREKYGDVFTFGMIGMKVTAYLGPNGNEFILNGKLADLNAEEVYGPLTVPIFGKGVLYDIPNAKLMDQKRLLKDGFTSAALRSYMPQFVYETSHYLATNTAFANKTSGMVDISSVLAEISLYTAAGTLQGAEVRASLSSTFGQLYRHLDDGFAPVNFMFPWLPLPINIRRDRAQRAMAKFYMDIITARRNRPRATPSSLADANEGEGAGTTDMLHAIMDARYKDGTPLSDLEIANLMIALLMGGQHNTASSGTWIMLELAHAPSIQQQLYDEQRAVLDDAPLTYESSQKLTLHNNVIKETLRLHSPIHSIMRKAMRDIPIPGTDMVVPKGHILLAAPGVPARDEANFPDPTRWDPHRWSTTTSAVSSSATTTATGAPNPNPEPTVDYGYGPAPSKAVSSPYLPFGAGRHRCVGETFAYAQLLGILVTLVAACEWEQVDKGKEVPRTDYSSMFSRPVHPAEVRWRRRG
jgi:sterol 14alpha-demethylase